MEPPALPGRYVLAAQALGTSESQPVATLEVISRSSATVRSIELLTRVERLAREEKLTQAIELCRTGALIGNRRSVERYVQLVVRYSKGQRSAISELSPLAAIRSLNDAKFALNRTFYDLGHAPPNLRRETDAVEVAKSEIVEMLFGQRQ